MDERLRSIETIVASRRGEHGALLSILEDVQRTSDHNYLKAEELACVARALEIPLAQVYSVATFYAFFNLKPQGEHVITVCRGTACHTRGSKPLLDKVLAHLGVTLGDDGSATTDDYQFTVQTVACFGQCALAPVIAIDEVIHSKVSEDQLIELVRSLQQGGQE
ncbi:MAG: NAD(P)H-dependent oxidoreductase subunit E [Sphaerochaeta sp.]|nr:NAD(P)H-dependent oxidoreductase subunit E [Sphaerochaeta sp.]MDX9916236.1 NAD(P)H-dependent oxidoreductase subunit E [Sphaerochaeta sp.]